MKRILLLFLCAIGFMTANAEDITIFAAASTTNAVNEIKAAFEAQTGNKVIASYASSGTLAKQIDNSAPAAIFISANQKWMDWLDEKGKVEKDTVKMLLANRLVLVTPASSTLSDVKLDAATTFDLLSKGKIAVGDPAHVPAGQYAQKTLESLGVWDKLEKNLARMQDVRAALALVEKNAVPFGIVYSSDAGVSKQVKIAGYFDEDLHGPIRYPYAIINGKSTNAVKDFYSFLKTDYSAKIFEKYGFQAVK